jgi:hypothetical protein
MVIVAMANLWAITDCHLIGKGDCLLQFWQCQLLQLAIPSTDVVHECQSLTRTGRPFDFKLSAIRDFATVDLQRQSVYQFW